MKLKTGLLFLFSIALFSCSKELNLFEKEDLPHFENINNEEIFSKEDSYLKDKSFVVNSLKAYYEKVWNKGNLSGGILIAKGNQILFESYRGFAQEYEKEPIRKDTPLHVASVSKSITAMAVLKLVEAGKLNLHEKVVNIFPGFPYPDIEVFHLLSHRSGLPKYEHFVEELKVSPKNQYFTNEEILNILVKHKPGLARNTNTGFMYCNTNYALLALIVEKITKTTFPDAMQRMVFKPLQMEHSYILLPKNISKVAQSFYNHGGRYPIDKLDGIYGDKNCYTTPRDLLKFSQALYSEQFLRKSLKDSVFTPYSNEKAGVNNYGLGFRMKNFINGKKLTYHNGWWHGTNSCFAHLLDSKVTIIAIGNKYSNRVYSALALSALFEDMPEEREKYNKTMSLNKETSESAE